jgi:anti-sigma factor RsiW
MTPRLIKFFGRRNEMDECVEVRKLLSDLVDSDLSESDLREVERHLSECEPCASFMITLRATIALLENTPKDNAPVGFRDRVREHLQKN